MQVLGAVQVPCASQAGEQTGVVHVAPVHPVLQVQVLGAVQLPFTQAGEQTGVVHVAPVHPVLQVQIPDEQLAFVPQLVPLLLVGFEQTPVEVLQVPAS